LGELCTISKGHGYSKADIRDAGTPLILYGRLYTQYESRIENVDTFAVEQEGSLLSKGNEVIVPASGETAEDIAVASSVRRSGIIFGGDLNVVTSVSKLDPDHIELAITYSKAHDDLVKRAQGKSVVHVHGNDIAEVEIPYPSESEQKRISTVVLGLDHLITLHQRMCFVFCFCAHGSRTNCAEPPMPGRPPLPPLAPPRSLRTRLVRQGAKNFCCAKLGPCRVFASLLAFGQNLSGFRITRQAKGAGHEQTEVIMSNFELQEKAVKAATCFIERKGFELLETGWTPPRGNPNRPDRQRRGLPGLHRRRRHRVRRWRLRERQGEAQRP